MGRQSLAGKNVRLRTVDDDLADSNMTRQDLAVGEYRFKRVWACLRKQGWHSKSGGPLSYDHFYIKPGKDLERGVEGVDYFYGEATLVGYAIDIGLFNTPGAEETYSSATSESSGTPTARAGAQPARGPSVESNGAARRAPSSTTSSADETQSQSQSLSGEKKPRNVKAPARPKIKQEVPSRQWPASHKFKGRHADDAISLLDSDDSDDEEDTPVKPGKAMGKRKMNRVETEEDTGEEHGNRLIADDGGDSDEGDDTQSNATMESEDGSVTGGGKRPLLKTRVAKKAKIEAADEKYRNQYKSKSKGVAHKVKSAPRGVMFQPNASLKTHGRIALEETTPPPHKAPIPAPASPTVPPRHPQHPHPSQKSKVAHNLSSAFEGTIKTEVPPFLPPSSPARPPSRASVASSHHSAQAAPRMSEPSPCAVVGTVFDVDGVVFKSVPDEVYRVTLSTSENDESTLLLEEQNTKRQQSFTFPDISRISQEAPGSFPRHVLELAFFQALKDVGKEAIVSPPPPPVVKEEAAAANGAGTVSAVDLSRDEDGVSTVVLSFPFTPFYSPTHRFPLTPVPESERVHVLMQELEQTKRDLDLARSDMEAFKKQHEMLEREYQKTRKVAEQLRRTAHQKAPPVPTSSVSSPASNHPRVQVNTGVVTAGATTIRMNARTFHGHASWLSMAFPPCPGSVEQETWPVVWDNVVMNTPRLYAVSCNGIKFADVEVKVRGSYQLNVFVTHNPAVSLEVVISNPVHTPKTPVMSPSLIQIAESEDNKKCTSRFDCIIECNVNDAIHVRSRSRNPANPMNGPIVWLRTFSPPPNTWLMNYVDKHFLNTNEEFEQKGDDEEHPNGTEN